MPSTPIGSATRAAVLQRRILLQFLLVGVIVLCSGLASVAVAQQAVTVTINRFIQGQDPDPVQVADAIDSADVIGDGDFYARIRIGNAPFQRNRSDFIEGRDIRPFWRFSRIVTETGTIPVVIQIWDADEFENNDDIIDLNDTDNSQDLVLNLDLATCTWDGDAGPNGTTGSGDGDGEHFGAAEGGERGHLFFDLACSDGDFDDDGLPDAVERFGVFDLVNGTWTQVVDMPGLGTNPCRKTILVEIDAVSGAAPRASAVQIVRDAFEDAPIDAPIPACPYAGFGPSRGGIDFVADVSDTTLPPTRADAQGNFQLDDVAGYKGDFFDPRREPYFHYNLWVPSASPTPGRCCSGSRGTDFISQPLAGARAEAALLMHELGHALGLPHSGQADIDRADDGTPVSRNCKPNYVSIMNYIFPTGILDTASGNVVVDFSREPLPTIDEDALNENVPLDDSTLQTCWSPFLGISRCGALNTRLNWNGSRTATTPPMDVFDPGTVSVDANAFAIRECGRQWSDDNGDGLIQLSELDLLATPGDVLAGSNDWDNLTFKGPLIDAGGGILGEVTELTEEEIAAAEAALQARLRCSPPEDGPWLIGADCTIWRDVAAPAGVHVASGVTLRVGGGVHLDVDLEAHGIRVDDGGRLLIDPGARID